MLTSICTLNDHGVAICLTCIINHSKLITDQKEDMRRTDMLHISHMLSYVGIEVRHVTCPIDWDFLSVYTPTILCVDPHAMHESAKKWALGLRNHEVRTQSSNCDPKYIQSDHPRSFE
jgi:hypothetical protein